MNKRKGLVVYLHGVLGSAEEARAFSYIDKYDVVGLDYEDGAPWVVGPIIKKKFDELAKPFKQVIVIANSMGAFYTYSYLDQSKIKQAFFISPLASMKSIIKWRMDKEGVSEKELKHKKYIKLDNGHEFDYYFYKKYVLENYVEKWNVSTEILYAENDEVIKREDVQKFVELHPNTKLTIKQNSQHYLHTPEELEFIKNWILERIE